MLFCSPHPPVQLRPRAVLTMGRSRSCELRLDSGDASRRHAEIAGSAEGFTIRDLGSTNGTYVNGEPIREHVLRPGDRIEIGPSTITFCQVGGGLESMAVDHDSVKTIHLERPAAVQVFEGELSEIPPFAVLQILEMGRKSGLLQCKSDDGVGRLWLVEGAPIHADIKDKIGFDAAISIVNATSGRFSFQSQSVEDSPTRTIDASITELLLEASRVLDEEPQ